MQAAKTPWPHAPAHRLSERGAFIVTAGTYGKHHYFRGSQRLTSLQTELLKLAQEFGWQLEAWAVFSNHYHFVAQSPETDIDAASLEPMLTALHSKTAIWVNRLDQTAGRKVWHNFWETRLTYEKSYLARLNYVHQNAVKHGLVPVANQYSWCSAGWFERTASESVVKTIYRFRYERVKVYDEYDPAPDKPAEQG